ncbi:MAG: REP-associated tyrosine transposase [Kosmotogales bacterium]|nr:REP-associated tyrosine transposase [Kosmotogales bacterium]
MDKGSLAHTKWRCKYHIVFAPKYRRQIIYGKIKTDIGKIMWTKRSRNNRGKCMQRSHTYISKHTPKISVSQFMGYLKGKSSLMIFDRHANLKYRYGNRKFWCKGYYECCILGKPTSSVNV